MYKRIYGWYEVLNVRSIEVENQYKRKSWLAEAAVQTDYTKCDRDQHTICIISSTT